MAHWLHVCIRQRSPRAVVESCQLLFQCAGAGTPPAVRARSASIPAPSFRGRAAALGRPAQGGRVAHALALYRRLVAPRGAPFLRTAGPLGPWRGGSRGPERVGRHGGGQAAPSGGPRLRLVAFVSSPPAWRPPVGCRLGFPSPAGPRLCGRWPGPGALGSRGAGGCAPFRFPAPSFRLAPSGCFPRPLCRLPRCLGLRGCQFSLPPPPPLPPRWGSRGARGLRPWGLPPPLRSPCSCVCFRRRPRGWCFLRRYAGRGQFYQGGSGFRA